MNNNVLRRFIFYMFIATAVMFTGYYVYGSLFDRPTGDYEAEKGDMHLGQGEYDQAIEWFRQALQRDPEHLGAHMGIATAYLQQGELDQAIVAFTALIDELDARRQTDPNDDLARQAQAVAFANRGIARDREGRYRKALDDYVAALKIDDNVVDGPGIVDKIIHNPRPSTVRKRARFIYEQLQLPESERRLSIPELDARERMYKP